MSKLRRKSSVCYNCGTQLVNGENYCPNCGQENHSKQASTMQLLKDFFDTYLSFDSKLLITLRPLFFQPGMLTKEYLDGKRARFVPPIRLLIFTSFLYFGISYLIGDGSGFNVQLNNIDSEEQKEFIDLFQRNINLMILIFTPIHALVVMLFFRSKERSYYVNFFVFTLHLFALLFSIGILVRITLTPVIWLIEDDQTVENIATVIQFAIVIYLLYYSVKALKVAFNKRYTIPRFIGTFLISIGLFFVSFLGYLLLLMRITHLNEL